MPNPQFTEAKNFENTISELLHISGYDVKSEILVGHKKVDLYFETKKFGSTWRTAVECKHYSGRLEANELAKIHADYRALYDKNLIDDVLIVTLNGLTPAAEAMVNETRILSHTTLSQLENQIIDFSSYLNGLESQFHEGGLSSFYISPRNNNGAGLDEYVFNWVSSDSYQPIAILGGYGMGKTTFAKKLAHDLSKEKQTNISQRTPILVRLGEISSEQSLEGLLGKLFTATSPIRNYSFASFMALNSAGHFVIILDGFDEMKHTLSWDDFKYNFKQLNRLINGKSKVVLLGRPTAFLNDFEHQHALHGIRITNGQELREADWPDYEEIYLASFNQKQVEEFLWRYLSYKIETAQTEKEKKELRNIRFSKVSQIANKRLRDITKRPVQLKMIAEVLPQWKGEIDNLTISVLYQVFIDLIIEREIEKGASRSKFTVPQRRMFASDIAVWLWSNKTEMSISPSDIPDEIIRKYINKGDNIEAVRRDLVSACFLERKLGESLYFPHRSFQEFLVAEAILSNLKSGDMSLRDADILVTDEVSSFLEGLVNTTEFRHIENNILTYFGVVSWRLAKIWCSDEKYTPFLFDRLRLTNIPWYVLFITTGICLGRIRSSRMNKMMNELVAELLLKIKTGDEKLALLCCLCLIALSKNLPNNRPIILGFVELANRWDGQVELIEDKKRKSKVYKKVYMEKYVHEVLKKINISKKQIIVLSGIYPELSIILRDYCLISSWILGGTIKTEDIELPEKINVSEQDISSVQIIRSAQSDFGINEKSFYLDDGKKVKVHGRYTEI